METTFNIDKLEFFIKLRKDNAIQGSIIEEEIRNVTEKIISYTRQANSLNSSILRYIMKKPIRNIIDFDYNEMQKEVRIIMEQKYALFNIDFKDIEDISCCVGKWQDKRSWIQRKLKPKTSLDEKIKEYSNYYEQSKIQSFLDIKYVDKDAIDYFSNSLNFFSPIEKLLEYQKKLMGKCKNYLEREIELLRLSDLGELIIREKTNDLFWLTDNWYENELSGREVKKLSGVFKKQAKINEFRFKTLYFQWEKLRGNIDAEKYIETLHQGVINDYNHFGFVNFV